MKYIKKFENYDDYYTGDYVLLDLDIIEKSTPGDVQPLSDRAQIVSVEDSGYDYVVNFYNGVDFSVDKFEIIRKLTPEEIEEFKIKQSTNKYNL